jgi:hypothetical protein
MKPVTGMNSPESGPVLRVSKDTTIIDWIGEHCYEKTALSAGFHAYLREHDAARHGGGEPVYPQLRSGGKEG